MRRLFFAGTVASIAFAACVGNDPTAATDTTTPDGGGSDATGPSGDGSLPSTDAATSDGATPTTCDPSAKFGTPVALDALNAIGPSSYLRLASDGLSAYYSAQFTDGAVGTGIFEATRATLSDDFSAPTPLLGSPGIAVVAPTISGDSLAIYFSRTAVPSGGLPAEVNVLTRQATSFLFSGSGAALGPPVDGNVDGGGLATNFEPFMRADGTEMYFTSERLDVSGDDIFRASASGDGGFLTATPVTELGAYHATRSAAVTPDGLVLYFASLRGTDGGTETNWTIYVATRAASTNPFSNITRVDELALDQDSFPTFISSDRCTLFFMRQTVSASFTSTLYKVTKSP